MKPDNQKTPPPTPTPTSKQGLEEIFRLYEKELLGMLFHLLGNAEDALDSLQEGFVRCWKHKDQLSEIVNLQAWVFRIVFNVGQDVRKNAWRKRRKAFAGDESTLPDKAKTPDELCSQKEEIDSIRQIIQQLDETEKEVFLLRQDGLLTYEQIAQIINAPVGTVKTRMRRALSKLQRLYLNQSFPSETRSFSTTEDES